MMNSLRAGAAVVALALLAASCGTSEGDSVASGTTSVPDELTEVAPAESSEDSASDDEVEAVGAEDEQSDGVDDSGEAPASSEVPEAPSVVDAPTTTSEQTTSTTTTTTTTTTTAAPTTNLASISLDLQRIAVLSSPVAITTRPGSNDLFIAEQQGRIVRLPGGLSEGADTTLDIRGQVSLGNEQGLLGLAFAPDGDRLYVNFTDVAGTTTIARYDMAGAAADPASVEILLTIPQPAGNHNGGQLAFGPDGFLYIGMGDGGGGGDPFLNGQNTDTLHGAILRIDVSADSGYVVPPSNPFTQGAAPEVFVWGIRNAWRFGFDSATGDLWVGDVGQDRFEEITVLRAADGGGNGANLGWNATEGTESFRGAAIPADHVAPAITYGHANGRCSITGGEVYRGSAIPELAGTYLYGDFCSGEVFGFRVDGSATEARLDIPVVSQLTSFGLDASGEMYVLSRAGGVFRIVS